MCSLLFNLQIKYSQRSTVIDGLGANADDYEYFLRFQKPVKPDDQLDLTEAELAEDITKHLDTEHKNYPKNLVVYSFKDYAYVPVRFFHIQYNLWWIMFLKNANSVSFRHRLTLVYCLMCKGIQYPLKMEMKIINQKRLEQVFHNRRYQLKCISVQKKSQFCVPILQCFVQKKKYSYDFWWFFNSNE